ncbi:MAG: carboxylating nicotinate-nucleotide diphosphorylase [Nitrospinae bacterium]|nr:carboxylating nicotinate-nucleotide diphosphorylase [Nitrospinota bacterium]
MIPIDQKLIETALREDACGNDITTLSTVPASARCVAKLVAKQDLTLAGIGLFEAVFKKLDRNVLVAKKFRDGAIVPKGAVIALVKGKARAVLTAERTALNFLQRLCGIATISASFVEAVDGTQTKILDTRKTTPGLRDLEKYAVRMGGAENHRRDLSAMALIKENHIAAAGGIAKAVRAAKKAGRGRFVEVEVTNLAELAEALTAGADRVLLDNMTLAMVKKAVKMAKGRAQTEASGNMNLKTVRRYAKAGVDYISVGALTHSAPAADLSLLIVLG